MIQLEYMNGKYREVRRHLKESDFHLKKQLKFYYNSLLFLLDIEKK